jgi:hypothetical protein
MVMEDNLEDAKSPNPLELISPRQRGKDSDQERSPILIASFLDGYAAGWKFAVPEAFRESLDIRYTPRQVDKHIEYMWTQGTQFNFTTGDLLYDTPLAYNVEWNHALRHITLFVQIAEATPTVEETVQSIQVQPGFDESSVDVSGPGKAASAKTRKQIFEWGMTIRRTRIRYGEVKFKILRPTPELGQTEEVRTMACNQLEFVSFLQTGLIRGADRRLHDIFKEMKATPSALRS